MSVKALSETVRTKILNHIIEYEDSTREEMNKGVTAMDISPTILKKNFTKMSIARARVLFEILENIIVAGNTKKFISEADLNQTRGVRYLYLPGKIILIARNYQSLRNYLTNTVSKNRQLIDTELGIGKLQSKDEAGELMVDDHGNPIYSNRSKFDIGHTVGYGREEKNAVAASRIYNAFSLVGALSGQSFRELQSIYNGKFEDAHIKYKADFTKEVNLAADLVAMDLHFVYTVPQAYSINSRLGQMEKKIIGSLKSDLADMKGSPSIIRSLFNQAIDMFMGRKPKPTKSKTSVSGKTKPKKLVPKVKTRAGARVKYDKAPDTATVRLSDLLQPMLTEAVGFNMDHASYFKTRTGTFTKSVRLTDVRSGPNNIIVKYNYLQNPYNVFEPFGTHHRDGREPSYIIDSAIRDQAKKIVGSRFNIKPIM